MRRITIAGIVAVGLTLSACNRKPARVVVGVAISQTHHAAVELAAREINASGGIGGVPVELMGLEWRVTDYFDSVEVLKWAHRFAERKELLAVVGHSDSASTLSAAAVYNQKKVPQVVTIATNPAITNIGTWTYRLCLSDAVQGPALAEYAVRDWEKKRIAVFYVNDAYGRGLAELFENRVRDLGAEVVSSTMHRNALGLDDLALIRLTVSRLKQQKPDVFVLFQRMAAALSTIKIIREAGFKTDVLGGDALSPIQFVQSNPTLTEGMRISQFFVPGDDPRAVEFIRNLRESAHTDADYARALAYDAMYLIRDAVLNGGYTREGVKEYLDQVIAKRRMMDGVGGAYSIGADHDARRPLYIAEIRNGGHRVLKMLQGPSS